MWFHKFSKTICQQSIDLAIEIPSIQLLKQNLQHCSTVLQLRYSLLGSNHQTKGKWNPSLWGIIQFWSDRKTMEEILNHIMPTINDTINLSQWNKCLLLPQRQFKSLPSFLPYLLWWFILVYSGYVSQITSLIQSFFQLCVWCTLSISNELVYFITHPNTWWCIV